MNEKKLFIPETLPTHESALRGMVADAHQASYKALRSLADAQAEPNGVVILEGDDGGQIYVVARASIVQCSETALARLLATLDAKEWNDPGMARVFFEVQPVGSAVSGGMGGGLVAEGVWVHPRLASHRAAILDFLSGNVDALERMK